MVAVTPKTKARIKNKILRLEKIKDKIKNKKDNKNLIFLSLVPMFLFILIQFLRERTSDNLSLSNPIIYSSSPFS